MSGSDLISQSGIEILTNGKRSKIKNLSHHERKNYLRRVIKRTPEVLLKVSGGGKTVKHVFAHMTYITRNGALEAVTQDGEKTGSREDLQEMLDTWDLDMSRGVGKNRLAFNIIFSMPAGTDSKGLFKAVQNLAREEFYGKYQYIMVLHTPETDPSKNVRPHPHVHLCIKAEGYDGKRLYIRKADLEKWRGKYAENLRDQGIEANATPREIRGRTLKGKKGPVYHAEKRGASTVLYAKLEEAGKEIKNGRPPERPWEVAIIEKRKNIIRAFVGAAQELKKEGEVTFAKGLERYVQEFPKPETERHMLKQVLISKIKEQRQVERDQGGGGDR